MVAMKKIAIEDLVHMDGHNGLYVADVVYADAAHPENVFGCALYHADAQIYLHKRLADVVLKAAALAKGDGFVLWVNGQEVEGRTDDRHHRVHRAKG